MAEGEARQPKPPSAAQPQQMTVGTEFATLRDVVVLIAVLLVLTVTLGTVLVCRPGRRPPR